MLLLEHILDMASTLAIRAVDVSLCLLVLVLGLLCSTIVSKTGTSHSLFVLGLLCSTIVSKTGTSHSSFVLGLLCSTIVSKTGTSHSSFVLGLLCSTIVSKTGTSLTRQRRQRDKFLYQKDNEEHNLAIIQDTP